METTHKPYDLHVLVCTNTRPEGQKKSCGPLGAEALRVELKDWLKSELDGRPELKGKVRARVNGSGCLDFCSKGIAIALYPDADFIVNVCSDDTENIKQLIRKKLDSFK